MDSNRVRVAYVEESTLGTTPAIANGNFRTARITGESLNFNIANTVSDELRSDRMIADLVQTGAQNSGDINFELSFPAKRTFFDQFMGAGLFSDWIDTAEKFNVTSDTSITDAGTTANTFAIDAQPTNAFVVGHMVSSTGFTNSGNNVAAPGTRVTSVTSTTVVFTGLSLTAETAPPAGARLKTHGWRAASGDVSLSVSGNLYNGVIKVVSATTSLDTVGLRVGQWIKLSGLSTAGNNIWGRITGFGGTSNREMGLDSLRSSAAGYTPAADAGAAQTVTIWFGDVLRNGTTLRSFSIEKGFLSQVTPNYGVFTGMSVGNMSLSLSAGSIITGNFSFLGMLSSISTSALGSPVAASSEDVLNAVSDVIRLNEGGAVAGSPVREMTIQVNNNLREQMGIGTLGLTGIGVGRFDVTGSLRSLYTQNAIFQKYINGTTTSLSAIITRGSRAFVITIPAVEYVTGQTIANGGNSDVLADMTWQAKIDTATNCMLQFDRIEYFA